MKLTRLIALLLLTLTAPALSDGPPLFADALCMLPLPELADRCITAAQASDTRLTSVCTGTDGAPLIVQGDYTMFAVMARKDGLMALCCFRPDGDDLALDWHNDLLLSYYQDIALTTQGAAWSGGITPRMTLLGDRLQIWLPLEDGLYLMLTAVDAYHHWQVREFTLLTGGGGRALRTVFRITEDSLADDIYLETCMPSDWRYREE